MIAKAFAVLPRTEFSEEEGISIDFEILPLVMCKDCKYFDGTGWCEKNEIVVPTDGRWFCANGGTAGKAIDRLSRRKYEQEVIQADAEQAVSGD